MLTLIIGKFFSTLFKRILWNLTIAFTSTRQSHFSISSTTCHISCHRKSSNSRKRKTKFIDIKLKIRVKERFNEHKDREICFQSKLIFNWNGEFSYFQFPMSLHDFRWNVICWLWDFKSNQMKSQKFHEFRRAVSKEEFSIQFDITNIKCGATWGMLWKLKELVSNARKHFHLSEGVRKSCCC